MRKYILLFVIPLMLALSCTNDRISTAPAKEGSLHLSVKMPVTKAIADNAVITVAGASKTRKFSPEDLPETMYLDAGDYSVSFEAGEILRENPCKASWEENSYRGESEVAIEAGKMSAVTLTVRSVNMVSCVTFHESIESSFKPGYSFTVETEPGVELIYTSQNSGKCGYFILDAEYADLKWKFSGELQSNGKRIEDSGCFEKVKPGVKYSMSPKYSSSDGYLKFDVLVDTDIEEYEDVIEINPYCGNLVASEPYEFWAAHATVKAFVDESKFQQQPKVEFAYRGGGSDWQTVEAERMGGGMYQAVLTGLAPASKYSYKLYVDGNDVADPMHFSTEEAAQIPNGDFEATSNAESKKYTSFYDPSSSDPLLNKKYWDSGNSASASYGYVICSASSDVPPGIGSKTSAQLNSRYAIVKFAAGNIFVGEFAGLSGLNGKVNFGRPWTSKSRPSAVRFWYKYRGGKVNHTASGCPLTKNDYDSFKMEFVLGNWPSSKYGGSKNCPVQVNTGNTKTFWKMDQLPETVAYAFFSETGNGSLSQWKQVTRPFEYKSETEYPGYLYISIASSKYGDYFAGSDSSMLEIDNVEFVYE